MANPKIWSKEDVLKMWPQAAAELREFQGILEVVKAGLAAAQLGMALQLANVEFQRLQALPVVNEKLNSAVKDFLASNTYKGFTAPFILKDIQPSPTNPNLLEIIPQGLPFFDKEICDGKVDHEWEKRLEKLGKKFNVSLVLFFGCYIN